MKKIFQKIQPIHILCFGLGFLIMLSIYFIFLKPKPVVVPYDEKFIQLRTDSLQHEIIVLQKQLKESDARIVARDHRYDSLQASKNIINIVYANKDKEIDASNVNSTVTDLNRIFTKNGIK